MKMGPGSTVVAMLSLLEHSGCCLKVLNLDELHPPFKDLDTLLESIPSLECIWLSSILHRGGNIVFDILT